MPTEIEVKMKIDDLAPVRARLAALGAEPLGVRFELNQFLDTPARSLKAADKGLRLRSMRAEDGTTSSVITFKGPASQGEVKSREEIEFTIGSFDDAAALLGHLGYLPTLGFEKRRESWSLDDCLVELDELPHLGTFVEVEGASEPTVLAVRVRLGLESHPLISRGYIRMIDELVRERPGLGPVVRFSDRVS